jgi:hypothetical protein
VIGGAVFHRLWKELLQFDSNAAGRKRSGQRSWMSCSSSYDDDWLVINFCNFKNLGWENQVDVVIRDSFTILIILEQKII